MLRREDNVELFDAICSNLFVEDKPKCFDDAILKSIRNLKIDNIKSLKGLEQLVNLELLEIVGKEDSTNIFEYKQIYRRNKDNSDFDMQKVFLYYYGEYTKNQIKEDDIKYIYKLHLYLMRYRI